MASLKGGSVLSASPANGDNSTKIATTEFCNNNFTAMTFIRSVVLTNLSAGFPIHDEDFNTYRTVYMKLSPHYIGSTLTFQWTLNVGMGRFYNYDNSLISGTTSMMFYSSGNGLSVTKRTTEPYYDIVSSIAGPAHHWFYGGSGIALNSFTAKNFNSLHGYTVNVYGMD